MNLLVFGEKGTQLSDLATALKVLSPESVRVASNWSAFKEGTAKKQPDLAVLSFGLLVEEGLEIAVIAHEFLLDRGIPALVALGEENPGHRRLAEVIVGFENIVEFPFSDSDILEAVERASKSSSAKKLAFLKGGQKGTSGEFQSEQRPEEKTPTNEEDLHPRFMEQDSAMQTMHVHIPLLNQPVFGEDPVEPLAEEEQTDEDGVDSFELTSQDLIEGLDVREWAGGSPAAKADESKDETDAHEAVSSGASPEQLKALTVQLPFLQKGRLSEVSPIRIIHAHCVSGTSGQLLLEMERLKCEITILRGKIGLFDVKKISRSNRDKVLSAMSWKKGRYLFKSRNIDPADFRSLGEPADVMFQAIQRNMGLNSVLQLLNPFLSRIPVLTEHPHLQADVVGRLEGMNEFFSNCNESSLELMTGSGNSVEGVLKCCLFAHLTDLIVFKEHPFEEKVPIEYDTNQSFDFEEEAPPASKAEEDVKVLEQLGEYANYFQTKSPYEIFGLAPGCGEKEVKEAYYQLVKKHHPDTYGLARSPSVKPLAEMVFRQIREAFTKLTKLESSPAGTAPSENESVQGESPPGKAETSSALEVEAPSFAEPADEEPEPGPAAEEAAAEKKKRSPNRRTVVRKPIERRRQQLVAGRVTGEIPVSTEVGGKQFFKSACKLLDAGKHDRAAALFKDACEAEPESTLYRSYFAYSMCLENPNRVEEVIGVLLSEMKEENEKEAEWPALLLGHLYRAQGKTKEALSYYKKCLALNFTNIEAQRCLRLLDMRKKTSVTFIEKLFGHFRKNRE